MGLFGGSTTVVGSVVYNMAGDIADRPSFLKTTVASNIITDSKFHMSDSIGSAYANGPGMNLRQFHRWAKAGHIPLIGIGYSQIFGEDDLLEPTIAANITPHTVGNTILVRNVRVGYPDPQAWMLKYLWEESQDIIAYSYSCSYNPADNTITILNPDGTFHATFTPDDYDAGQIYITAVYAEYDSSDVYVGQWGFTYRVGSGSPALDSLVSVVDNVSDEFISAFPIRTENQFLSGTYLPDEFAQVERAYKKLTKGQQLSKLIAQLQDNPDLGDIDNIFFVNGVTLNTQEPASKKYIAKFFEKLTNIEFTSWATQQTYEEQLVDYKARLEEWKQWSDLYPGVPRPSRPVPPIGTPGNFIQIGTSGTDTTRLNIKITWSSMLRQTGTGLGKPGAKAQDVWWDGPTTDTNGSEIATLYWQDSDSTWISYTVKNMVHNNIVANGKSVKITLGEALADADESGFILPLHYETLRSMSIVDSTQVALSCSYLVMNCYKVVKQKWYQTGIFKIVIVLVIIAITIATAGTGTAPSVGILGSAVSVGTALGFTGLTAIVVGTLANAIAAMIIMKLIQVGAVAIFGEKLGAIIAAVAGVIAMTVGVGLANGMNMSAIWGSMGSASSIIGMTSAVGNGISGYVQASTQATMGKTQELLVDFNKESKEIAELFAKNIGYDRGAIDPTSLTDTPFGNFTETEAQFLLRTLMTGSDIAEFTQDMLTNFSAYTINTNLPLHT